MRNRRALAAAALLLMLGLAGCVDAAGSIRMQPVNDTALADRASHPVSDGEFYPAIRQQTVARRAIENGSVTIADVRVPARTDLPYRLEGRYYNLSSERVGTRPGMETAIGIDYNATNPNGTRLAFSDLSGADRRTLGPLLDIDPPFRESGPEVEFPLAYPRPAVANSTLFAHAGESLVVAYHGAEYGITIRDGRETTLDTYRYRATLRAESTRAYAQELKRTYEFDLAGLNESERSVIESALDDSYYAESTDDTGFAALVDRFRGKEAIKSDEYSGTWLARYDGQLYWVEMDYGQFVEVDTDPSPTPKVTPN